MQLQLNLAQLKARRVEGFLVITIIGEMKLSFPLRTCRFIRSLEYRRDYRATFRIFTVTHCNTIQRFREIFVKYYQKRDYNAFDISNSLV